MALYCPLCNTVDIGRVGTNQYFCWHCYVEFKVKSNNKSQIFSINDDGTLISLGKEDQLS